MATIQIISFLQYRHQPWFSSLKRYIQRGMFWVSLRFRVYRFSFLTALTVGVVCRFLTALRGRTYFSQQKLSRSVFPIEYIFWTLLLVKPSVSILVWLAQTKIGHRFLCAEKDPGPCSYLHDLRNPLVCPGASHSTKLCDGYQSSPYQHFRSPYPTHT